MLCDYPDVRVELHSDNTMRNIVEERFDAGIRLGESIDKDMIAVRIGPDWRLVAIASPGYVKQHGRPAAPQDLVDHICINLRQSTAGRLYAWEFARDGRELRVRVDGQLTFNTTIPIIDAALVGYGIACVPEDLVGRHVADGASSASARCVVPLFFRLPPLLPKQAANAACSTVIVEALRYRDPA